MPPIITSFTPASAAIDAVVTIVGTDFDPIPTNNTVVFNGVLANVLTSSTTNITAKVPLAALSGPIAVTVNGQTASSLTNFTVTPTLFKSLLLEEYPIPMIASIYGTTLPVETRASIDNMIDLALRECESWLEIYCSVDAQGNHTQLPLTTKAVTSVKMTPTWQGNRYVKWNYDNSTKVVTVRYFPATIKYKRSVTLKDLDTLAGSRMMYFKAVVMDKMLTKEINYLTAIRLDPDSGGIDITALNNSRDFYRDQIRTYGDDLGIMSNG